MQLEIDADVYWFIQFKLAGSKEEDVSSLLRRELEIPATKDNHQNPPPVRTVSENDPDVQEFRRFLESPGFLVHGSVLAKFLALLSHICRKDPKRFDAVLGLTGSKRKYFSRNADEMDRSGSNVMPRRVPDTVFFVSSNNDTPKKRLILADVMQTLGYGEGAITVAVGALR